MALLERVGPFCYAHKYVMRYRDIMETVLTSYLRNIIPSNLVGKVPVEDVEAAVRMLMKGHSLDNVNSFDKKTAREAIETVQDGLRELSRAFNVDSFTIYRTITAYETVDFSQPRHVGIYWTCDPNFTMGSHGDEDSDLIEMDGAVGPEGVDWVETIILQAEGHEAEIRLKPGAEIKHFSASVDGDISSLQYA